MKALSIAAMLVVASLVPEASYASYYLLLNKSRSTADFSLPEPLRTARIEVSAGRLTLVIAGKDVPIDNGWLGSIPEIDLDSATLARGSDGGADLYVLITCLRDDREENGRVVLTIRNFVVVERTLDGCAGV